MTVLAKASRLVRALGVPGAVEYMVKTKVVDRLAPRVGSRDRRHGTLHHDGAALQFRYGTSDATVFWQVFVREDYRDAVTTDPELIIDCGANVGYASAYFAARYPRARIIALEPDPANFAILQANVRRYSGRVVPVQKAVWSTDTGLCLVRDPSSRAEWGIRVRPCGPGERADVQATSISTLLAEHGCARADLLKIDIEGAELDLFAAGASKWLDRVGSVIIECHGQACREAFFAAVRAAGFEARELDHGMAVAHR
jgi:FkbM family methyltransferase